MVRRLNESMSMDELFDSIRRNAESIIADIDEIEGKGCKLNSDGMSLLKKAQKEIIGVKSRMSGVRTACSAKYGESVKRRYRRNLHENEDKLDGYAVAIKDTGKGYYHMITFDSKSDAETAYKALVKIGKDMDAGKYENDIKGFNKELDKVLDTADEVTNRIDKTEMYNDYWEAFDETRYEIVGYVDLWINW